MVDNGAGLEEGLKTQAIIAAAIEVHRILGPGYVESIYEGALVVELRCRGHKVERQVAVGVCYKGSEIGLHRLDLLVDDAIVIELKTARAFEPIHFAVVKSYLKAMGLRHGLLLNFAHTTIEVKRVLCASHDGTRRQGHLKEQA